MTRLFRSPFIEQEIIDLLSDSDDEVSLIDLTDDAESEGNVAFDIEASDIDDNEDSYDEEGFDRTAFNFEDFLEELALDEDRDSLTSKANDLSTTCDEERSPRAKIVLPFEFVILPQYTTEQGFILKRGVTVELSPAVGLDHVHADFLRIDSVLESLATDEITVRGTRFRRAHRAKGMLERKVNEVFMCQNMDIQDTRSVHDQSLEDIALQHVVCERTLILTNQAYPALSWRELQLVSCTVIQQIKEVAQLVCRYKFTTVSHNTNKLNTGHVKEMRMERLSQTDADAKYAVPDQTLRAMARACPNKNEIIDRTHDEALKDYKQTMRKVNKRVMSEFTRKDRGHSEPESVIDLDVPEVTILDSPDEEDRDYVVVETVNKFTHCNQEGRFERRIHNFREGTVTTIKSTQPLFSQKPFSATYSRERYDPDAPYTYGDAFCGAGGDSRGARSAGLKLKWAFDHWTVACKSYKANFCGTRVYKKEAFDFTNGWRETRTVDVLHLSPPCPTFSPAHTTAGKDDDANEASLFAVGALVQRARPRIVTLEETAGLQSHHPVFLYHLIQELTRLGYSVRWKVMVLSEYGLPQPRKRLIIIASCPGEPLPPFPEPTHGPWLRPFTTIGDALSTIVPGMANHEPRECIQRDFPSYDPDTQLKSCITCGGGEGNLHPSGRRTFTNRELACLQGFPHDHVFVGSKGAVMRQIGNAVPPVLAEQLYKSIIATLRATDAAEAAENGEEVGPEVVQDDVIMLD